MRLNGDERTVAAMDVLAPGIGEIVGVMRDVFGEYKEKPIY